MNYKFSPQISKESFQALLELTPFVDIFQSPTWVETSAGKGWKDYVLLGIEDDNGELLVATAAYINSSKGFGKYLYIQHGPVFHPRLLKKSTEDTNNNSANNWGEVNFADGAAADAVKQFINEVKQYCINNGYFALIMEPLALEQSDFGVMIDKSGFKMQKWSVLPKFPMYIDLKKPQEELLANADKNTRYYIRYAQKQGVEIDFVYADQDDNQLRAAVDEFYRLLTEAAEYKGYGLPPKAFFTKACELYKGTKNICFALARYQGEIISANYTQFYGKWASSYYTANSRRFPKLRASYLLKWATILEAQAQGKEVFDMWGQIPGLTKDNPEYGYGQFKRSFAPIEKTLVGRSILAIHPTKYALWQLLGRVRYILSH